MLTPSSSWEPVSGTGDLDFAVSEDKVSAGVSTLVYGGTKSALSGMTDGYTYAISGTYVASTGVFTAATIAAGGFHTLIATAASATALEETESQVILKDVLNTSITSSNVFA